MLVEIVKRGSGAHREAALETLGIDATLRSMRAQAEARRAVIGAPRSVRRTSRYPGIDRVVRTAAGGEDLAVVVRREGDAATGDAAVDEAFESLGVIWDFFFDVLARDSIDNAGMTLDAVVHYGHRFDNAFWDGDQLIFGDGSGAVFTRLTRSLAVCAHELSHGVIQFDGPLAYRGQSGALDEHIADAFAAMVEQWRNGQTVDTADWLIGKEILADGVYGRAIRSLKEPGTAYDDDLLGKDPQPAHMDDYVETDADYGGVHINSGIPNRAFYEIASRLGGYSWEHVGRILYATLGNAQLRPTASFRRFARLNLVIARQLYGHASREAAAVGDGWQAVGVTL